MSPAKQRGTALQDRVLRRYRDRSPWSGRIRKLLTAVVFLAWLGGVFLLFGVFTGASALRLHPFVLSVAVVVGIAITLLIACAHQHTKAQRLWQVTRHEPIRRRSWLRWLGVGRALTCPFCRDDLGSELCECPECAASYHPECVEELHACATLGCEGLGTREPRPQSKAKPKVSLTGPSLES